MIAGELNWSLASTPMRSNCPTARYSVALKVCVEIEKRVKKENRMSRVPFFHVLESGVVPSEWLML